MEETDTMFNQFLALFNAELNTELSHLLIIILNRFESIVDSLGNLSLTEVDSSITNEITIGSYL